MHTASAADERIILIIVSLIIVDLILVN